MPDNIGRADGMRLADGVGLRGLEQEDGRERARFWRLPDLHGLEVLHATYLTHTFARTPTTASSSPSSSAARRGGILLPRRDASGAGWQHRGGRARRDAHGPRRQPLPFKAYGALLFLTDEGWALGLGAYARGRRNAALLLGSGLLLYLTWLGATLCGCLLGNVAPDPAR